MHYTHAHKLRAETVQKGKELTETLILRKPPVPELLSMLTCRLLGGVHCTRLYWMSILPPNIGAICNTALLLEKLSWHNKHASSTRLTGEACKAQMHAAGPESILYDCTGSVNLLHSEQENCSAVEVQSLLTDLGCSHIRHI